MPPETAQPLISVVLPCFNASETLAEAVHSVRQQTYSHWELLVVDDGSTDGSGELAERLAAQDRRIRVSRRGRRGIVEALRFGCGQARGPLIARMDADDVSLPERLERQAAFLRANPDVGLCGTLVSMTGPALGEGRMRYETWVNSLVSHEDLVRELFVECPVPHPTWMVRREAFAAVGGYQDRGWPEDYDLLMRLYMEGMRFGKVPDVLLEWRERPDRLSMTDARYSPARFRALKRHYLFLTHLRSPQRPFYQWGAGEVGKLWLREWGRRKPRAVADINPRKIGRAIHGVLVIAPEELPAPGDALVVVAVGAPGARGEIRGWLVPRGYREGRDFLFLA